MEAVLPIVKIFTEGHPLTVFQHHSFVFGNFGRIGIGNDEFIVDIRVIHNFIGVALGLIKSPITSSFSIQVDRMRL